MLDQFQSLVKDVLQRDAPLVALFSSGAIGRNARRDLLEKALKDRIHPLLHNFLHVLNDHERIDLLRPILAAAQNLDDERNRRLQVTVSTAVPLTDDFRDRVANGVRGFFHLEPVLIEQVDPDLLGGMKVRIGDVVYDSTVRNRIDTLKHQLLARSSHEIQSGRDRFSSAGRKSSSTRTRLDTREVGRVLEVGDGIARVYGLAGVMAGEMVEFTRTGVRGLAFNLEENSVGIIILGDYLEIDEGDEVQHHRRACSQCPSATP